MDRLNKKAKLEHKTIIFDYDQKSKMPIDQKPSPAWIMALHYWPVWRHDMICTHMLLILLIV